MQLSLDRKSFIDILGEGQYDVGAVLQPPPEGIWGMPQEMLQQLTGYGPDVQKNREEAREHDALARLRPRQPAEGQGVGAQHRLVSRSRGDPDRPAEGDLDRRRARNGRDRQLGPEADAQGFYCRDEPLGQRRRRSRQRSSTRITPAGSSRNYTGCNPEVDALIDQQSAETDPRKRKELVWQIERKLIEDAVRPIIFFMRQGTCWQPEVKGLTLMDNSIFNSWRMEDVWLDK